MDSYDLIDSVLQIGNSDVSDGLFRARFAEFYGRHFSPHGLTFNGARFIYMLYGAILTLPLTGKISSHNIDALLVAKRGNNLKLIISYATPDRSLSLKLLCFDGGFLPRLPFLERSVILDTQRLLSLVKQRSIQVSELEVTLNIINEVTFQYRAGQSPMLVRPKIAKIPHSMDHALMNSHFEFPELLLVRQGDYAESASIFVAGLQSHSYDVVRYNSHELTKLLIAQHVLAAQTVQLSLSLDDVYLFLLGALEMNWARSYHLNMNPIFEASGHGIAGLIVCYQEAKKPWKSQSTPFVLQLLTRDLPIIHESYASSMYKQMVKKLPHTLTRKIAVIGIDHERLLEITRDLVHISTIHLLSFTFLLDLNPMENLVDLLLNPFVETTLPRMDFCIKTLNWRGKYGLHAYLYGQLMSHKNMDIEKYVYHSGTAPKGRTLLAFKLRGSDGAVIFNIVQTSSIAEAIPQGDIPPAYELNVQHLLQITVHQTDKEGDDVNSKLQLTQIRAQFVDISNHQSSKELQSQGDWLSISSVNPDDIIHDIENRPEFFRQLSYSETLHTLLDSIDNTLLKFGDDRISFHDIINFLSGLFSDWQKIFYSGFLGLIKNDGSVIFVTTLQASDGDQEHLVGEKLKEISTKYIRRDYIRNELRRVASFICITHTVENENRFGIGRFSTFGDHKTAFERCLKANSKRKVKRKPLLDISCPIDDESLEQIDNDSEKDEESSQKIQSEAWMEENHSSTLETIRIKTQLHLKTVAKVSKVIMTAQIFKDMISDLLRGDYKSFAVSTAFLASGPLLECLSMKMVAKGVTLSGGLLGRSMLISAPFLGRLPIMGFVGFDLYEQVKAYKSGDKGALVNIAGDSAILSIDFVSAGIEGAEALEVVSGVADITGPIGLAVGTAIFVGVDIYDSVRTVASIDAMVHLTGWQKFTTGFLSFLHIPPTKTVRAEIFEKRIADASVDNAAKFFRKHPFVEYYFFPSYQENGKFVENNIIDLNTNVTRIAHSWPKEVDSTKLICSGNSELSVSKTSKLLLNCSHSFGYESASEDEVAVILLEHGNDTVKTFTDKPTTFLIGNGRKFIVGSNKDDVFFFNGNHTIGYINGKSGNDVLNLENFSTGRSLKLSFRKHRLTYSGGKVKIFRIRRLVGRRLAKEVVSCDCHTQYLDTQGGLAASPDLILLKEDCSYDITIRINGIMNIKNSAQRGNFKYFLSKNFFSIVSLHGKTAANHQFTFEHSLDDLIVLDAVSLDNASFCYNLTFKSINGSTLILENIHSNVVYVFKDQSELKINNGAISIDVVSNETVINIYEKYAALSKKLNAIIRVYSASETINLLFGGGKAIHHSASNEDKNHINILPNDPIRETYLIGGENQNVFRISMPHLHDIGICSLRRMPSVRIFDYASNNYINVIDLYEIILLIHERFRGQVTVKTEAENSTDLLLRVYAQCPNTIITNLINITLDKALVDQNHAHVVVNMRRPMTIRLIENVASLIPALYHVKNETFVVIHSGMIEPNTTIVSSKTLHGYDFTTYNTTNLILTNLKYTKNEDDLIFMIFKDFFYFNEFRTLTLQFVDRLVELSEDIDEVHSEFLDFENIISEDIHRYDVV